MMKIRSHMTRTLRRDFDVADTTILDPNDSDAADAGEWLQFNSSGKLARPSADAEEDSNLYQVFTPKGSYDAQSLGKATVLFDRNYEVDTDMFDSGDTFSVGDKVGITLATVDGATRAVFTNTLSANTDYVYGVVTMDPDNNDDMLRVHIQSPYLLAA